MIDKVELDDTGTGCALTLAERDRLQRGLRALPETMPPRAVWHRIEQQGRAQGLLRPSAPSAGVRWLAGGGIAAAVVVAVLNLPRDDRAVVPRSTELERPLPTVPSWDPAAEDNSRLDALNALMVQSRLLERDLRRLPPQPQVARAGTLATIDDLQRRIAAIDYRLNDPSASLDRTQREAAWRERVRLMDSLVRLRYAQAQRVSF